MPEDRDTIREGDIEPIARRLTRKGRDKEDRFLFDKRGRKILYSVTKGGGVRIKDYPDE